MPSTSSTRSRVVVDPFQMASSLPDTSLAVARAYSQFNELSGGAVASAHLYADAPDVFTASCCRFTKNIQHNAWTASTSMVSVNIENGTRGPTAPPVLLHSSVTWASGASPSGNFTAAVRTVEVSIGVRSTIIEVRDRRSGDLLRTVHVEDGLHEDVISDGGWVRISTVLWIARPNAPGLCRAVWFGMPEWSPCEKYIVYVAEAKGPITTDLFRAPQGAHRDAASPYDWETTSRAHNWGEAYDNVRLPRLFVCSLTEGRVLTVPGTHPSISAGLPCWVPYVDAPSGASEGPPTEYLLVYVGWRNDMPRRLGFVENYHRHSTLYGLRFPFSATAAAHVCLTPNEAHVRSPRLSPLRGAGADYERLLAFLGFDGEPIAEEAELRVLRLNDAWWRAFTAAEAAAILDADTVGGSAGDPFPAHSEAAPLTLPNAVPIVSVTRTPVDIGGGIHFSGLFMHSLPDRCWSTDASVLWTNCVCRCQRVVIRVDIATALEAPTGASAEERAASAISLEVGRRELVSLRHTVFLYDMEHITSGADSGSVALLIGTSDHTTPEYLNVVVVPASRTSSSRSRSDSSWAPRIISLAVPPPAQALPWEQGGHRSPLSAGRAALHDIQCRVIRVKVRARHFFLCATH